MSRGLKPRRCTLELTLSLTSTAQSWSKLGKSTLTTFNLFFWIPLPENNKEKQQGKKTQKTKQNKKHGGLVIFKQL